VLFALTAVVFWGSQFPVAKTLIADVDAYTLSAVRFTVAGACLFAVLWIVEGRSSFAFDGCLGRATGAGILGYGAGVMMVYAGLEFTTTTSAAVIMATQPFITAVALRVGMGARLSRATRWAMITAFVGAALVVTRGAPSSLFDGSIGWGVILVLLGQVGWVLYTIDSVSFEGWSPLRYTTMTVLPGAAFLIVVAALLAAIGATHPTWSGVSASPLALGFSILGPAVLSLLAWNVGRARLGAQSIALFPNLVPVVTFSIEIGRGYQLRLLEVAGALLTIGALTASTLLDTRAHRRNAAAGLARGRVPAPEPI
jgi:drug/metabolite transporter (DMT)-like permease